jgi:hypothetical protein
MEGRCPKCDSTDVTYDGYNYDDGRETATCNECMHVAIPKYFRPYYQPIPIDGVEGLVTIDGNNLHSFEVYGDKEICENDFPNNEIKEYNGSDIEEPTFVDC